MPESLVRHARCGGGGGAGVMGTRVMGVRHHCGHRGTPPGIPSPWFLNDQNGKFHEISCFFLIFHVF